jgi:hypothetical protein
MKTLTEFSAFTLRQALTLQTSLASSIQGEKTADLSATLTNQMKEAGKTDEEIQAALPEALAQAVKEAGAAAFAEAVAKTFKIEGDKLPLFLAALEGARSKPRELENLKRIVVYRLDEGEKPSGKVQLKEGHGFLSEYFPPLHKGGKGKPQPERGAREERGARGAREGRGEKRRGKGRGPKDPKQAQGEPTGEGRQRRRRRAGKRPDSARPPRQENVGGIPVTRVEATPRKVIVLASKVSAPNPESAPPTPATSAAQAAPTHEAEVTS